MKSLAAVETAATGEGGRERFFAAMTTKNQITLPARFCRLLGLERGDRFELVIEPDGAVRMLPIRVVPDLQRFVGIWRDSGYGDGAAFVEDLRGPVEPEE